MTPRKSTAFFIKWSLLGTWVGLITGIASALFLFLLDLATRTRETHPGLIYGLPLAGVLIAYLYRRFGQQVEGGNSLLLERVHDTEHPVPLRMAPLILVTTVLTHLFGGSAGREGTAVQMGGALANAARGPLRLSHHDQSLLILSGISGGFGSVFGTPFAGAIFGMEVQSIGRLNLPALLPCLVASVVGDRVVHWTGISHQLYPTLSGFSLSAKAWLAILVTAVGCGVLCRLFVSSVRVISGVSKSTLSWWMRPLTGGMLVILMAGLLQTSLYLGLGLPLLGAAFTGRIEMHEQFAWKFLFTVITLGFGFKGGEVTPLFCIGATFGVAVAHQAGAPLTVCAAVGLASLFGSAAKTPIACIVLGMELFGTEFVLPLTAACGIAYLISGRAGIYANQVPMASTTDT